MRDRYIVYDNTQYYDNILSVIKTEKYFATRHNFENVEISVVGPAKLKKKKPKEGGSDLPIVPSPYNRHCSQSYSCTCCFVIVLYQL